MKDLKRDVWIDTLRGIAALGVMFAHLAVTFPKIGVRGSGTGKIFVCLFMCITGYYSFLNINKSENWVKDTFIFYGKRILAIFPQFLVCILLGTILGLYDLKTVGQALSFQTGLMHFWYIPVLLGFYLVVPFVRLLLSLFNSNKRVWIIATLILILEILFPWFKSIENSIEFWWYLPAFLIGGVAREVSDSREKHCVVYDVGVVICALIFILIIPGVREIIFKIPADGYLQNKLVFMTLLWAILLICLKNSSYIWRIVNRVNIFSVGAKYGYALYLIHYIILCFLHGKGVTEWRLVIETVLLSCIGAVVLYWGIQYPIQCLLTKIRK